MSFLWINMGLKIIFCIFSMSCSASNYYSPSHDLFTPIVRPENPMWVFFKIKWRYYSQTLLLKRSCIGWPNHVLPRPLVSTRVSKFDSFIHIAYDSSNPDTIIDLKSRSPLLLGIGGSVGLSVLSYLKWVICSLPSKVWVSFEKLFFCRISEFPRRRNSDNLINWL